MPERSIAPLIKDPAALNLQLSPCDRYILDNGVPVYSVDAGAQDVTLVELVFYAGNSYEDQNLVAATTNFLLKNGTTAKPAFEINEHFEYHGAYLNRTCANETASVTLHCLSKHLKELLPVVAEVITESNFREEELAIYKQNQKQRLEVNLKKCDFVANRFIDEYVYGLHHPYGRYTTAPEFDMLERAQLIAFFNRYYVNGRCLIFTAGKLPPDIREQLNNVFGKLSLTGEAMPEKFHEIKPASRKKHRIINDENGVQGAIRVACPFPNRHHPDFIKCQVLNNIFGGFFGSRLMGNIREDKGYTYGIHSYFQNHLQQSAWMISTEAGREVCEATIREIYNEMEDLREELVEDEELMLVRNYMMGSILADLDGPFQMIARWKNYILNGLTEDYFYQSVHTIKTITAEELMDLSKKYLNPDSFYELVVV